VADEYAARQTRRLADVLAALSAEDRRAVLQHVEAGQFHARLAAAQLRAAAVSEVLTFGQVERHLLTAIGHLELAAGALGWVASPATPRRPWWAHWWLWGRL
jgi:hypothetical protein